MTILIPGLCLSAKYFQRYESKTRFLFIACFSFTPGSVQFVEEQKLVNLIKNRKQ